MRTIKLFLNKAEFHCFHNNTFNLHENGRSLRQTVKRTPVFVVDNFFRSVDVLQHCAVAGAHSPSGADLPVRRCGAATPHTGHVVICASHLTSPRRPCYIPTPAMWLSIPFLSIYPPNHNIRLSAQDNLQIPLIFVISDKSIRFILDSIH